MCGALPSIGPYEPLMVRPRALSDELQRRCLIEANVLLGGEAQYHHDFSPSPAPKWFRDATRVGGSGRGPPLTEYLRMSGRQQRHWFRLPRG